VVAEHCYLNQRIWWLYSHIRWRSTAKSSFSCTFFWLWFKCLRSQKLLNQ